MDEHIIDEDMLKSARQGKRKAGKTDLINYLLGATITRNQAIKAKCFDCNGMGDTGECEMEHCPLYPFSPYRKSLGATLQALTEARN